MSTEPQPQNSDAFTDPRNRAGFRPELYPRVNGQAAPPPSASEPNERINLEFLSAYYDLNCAYDRLVATRQQAKSSAPGETEKKLLQNIERLLMVRDGLEDQYAPLGVIAEPVVKDGFTVNVVLSFGNMDAAGRLRSELYTITACVPIPLPKGFKLEDTDLKIEGPGICPQ